jgi:3-hydroxybutyryl-CoA dehydratase
MTAIDDLEVGQRFRGRLTVTEAHIVMATGIFGDFASIYVDDEFARRSSNGSRIAPAALISGIMTGVLGKALSTDLLRVVDTTFAFEAPVVPGDTAVTVWTVTSRADDPSGLLVGLDGVCTNQSGATAARGSVSILLAS